MQPNKLLTITDVAELLQVERHKASELMKLMPCFVMPGTRTKRVRLIDFEHFVTENVAVQAGETCIRGKKRPKPVEPYIDLNLFEPDGRIKRRRKGG